MTSRLVNTLSLSVFPTTLVVAVCLAGCTSSRAGGALAGGSTGGTASTPSVPASIPSVSNSVTSNSSASATSTPASAPVSSTPPVAGSVASSPFPDSGSRGTADAPTSVGTRIVIEFDSQQIAGQLDNSVASASLVAQLPLTLTLRDHAGQEKAAKLAAPLDLDGAPAGSDASPLTIGYYAPDQVLVLYYAQVGYFAGIVPLGTFQNADALRGQRSDFTVTIRKAN